MKLNKSLLTTAVLTLTAISLSAANSPKKRTLEDPLIYSPGVVAGEFCVQWTDVDTAEFYVVQASLTFTGSAYQTDPTTQECVLTEISQEVQLEQIVTDADLSQWNHESVCFLVDDFAAPTVTDCLSGEPVTLTLDTTTPAEISVKAFALSGKSYIFSMPAHTQAAFELPPVE